MRLNPTWIEKAVRSRDKSGENICMLAKCRLQPRRHRMGANKMMLLLRRNIIAATESPVQL